MTERKHNLPSRYDRQDDQITGSVVDAIVISPRSCGTLYMPGEHSTEKRPPAHQVKITSTDPGNQGVDCDQVQRGRPEHYYLSYDVRNYRDSPSFARIILTGDTTQADDLPADPDTGATASSRTAARTAPPGPQRSWRLPTSTASSLRSA